MSEAKITIIAEDRFSSVADQVADSAGKMKDELENTSDVGSKLREGFDEAGEGAKTMGESFEGAGEGLGGLGDAAGAAGEGLGTLGESATSTGESVGAMGEELTATGEEATTASDNFGAMAETMTTAGDEATTTGESLTTMGEALTETGDEAATTGDELTTMADSLSETGDKAETTSDNFGTMAESLGTAGDEAETASGDLDTMGDSLGTAGDKAETTGGAFETMGDAADTMGGAVGGAGEAAGTAGESFDTMGESAGTAGEDASTAAGSLDTLGESAGTAGDNSSTAGEEISGMGDAAGTAGEDASTAAGQLDTMADSASTAGDNSSTAGEEISGMGDAAGTAGEDANTAAGQLDTLADSASTAGGELDSAGASADTAAGGLDNAETSASETDTQMGALSFTAGTLSSEIETVGTSSDTAAGQVDTLASSVSTADGIFAGAGTSAGDFSANLDAVGGSADAAVGGLTPANTLIGDVGDTSETASGKISSMAGNIATLGGNVGLAISTVFRFQDAQLALDKANLKLEKSQEAARKAVVAFDTLLGKAKTNTDNIASAQDTYAAALGRVQELQDAGIKSGEEYEQAQADLAEATADLREEFVKGGGDANKFDASLKKVKLTTESAELATRTNEKAHRTFLQVMIDGGLQAVSFGGNIASLAGNMDKLKAAAVAAGGALKALPLSALGGAGAAGAAGVAAVMAAVTGLEAVPYDQLEGHLDDVGKKLGEVFPAGAPILKAFADAYRHSVDFLAKGTADVVKAVSGIDIEAKVAGKSFSQLVQEFMNGTTHGKEVDGALRGYVQTMKDAGFSEKEIVAEAKKHNAEFEKLEGTTGKADKVTADLTSRFEDNAEEIRKNVETSAEMQKAYTDIIGPTTSLTSGLEHNRQAVQSLTEADVKSVTELEKRNRSLIIQASGVNNAELAEIQYQQALTAATSEMVKDTDAKNANARAVLTLADSTENAQNTLATLREEYAMSVDRLADLNTTLESTEGHYLAVQTKVNEYAAGLKEEKIALEASIQATNDAKLAKEALDNAYLKGVESVDKWGLSVAEAAEAEQGAIDRLATFGLTFDDLPPGMDATSASLMEFKEGMEATGQAAVDFGEKVLQGWETFLGDIPGKIDQLVNIMHEGGEKMDEEAATWLKDFENDIGRNLTPAEQTFIDSFRKMKEGGEQALSEMRFEAWQGNLDQGIASAEQKFRQLETTTTGVFSQIAGSMADILGSGSQAAIDAAVTAFSSKAPPDEILKQLGVIKTELPNLTGPAADAAAARLKERLGTGTEGAGTEVGEKIGSEFETKGVERFAQAWNAIRADMDKTVGGMASAFDQLAVTPMIEHFGKFKQAWIDFETGLKTLFQNMAPAYQETAIAPMIEALVPFNDAWIQHEEGLKLLFENMAPAYQETAIGPMTEAVTTLNDAWITHEEGLKTLFTNMGPAYEKAAIGPMTTSTNKFSTDTTAQMKTKFGEAFGDINTKANTSVTTMKTKYDTAVSQITAKMKTDFGAAFGDINTKANTSATHLKTKFDAATSSSTQKIKSDFSSAFSKVKSDAASAASKMESDFKRAISSIKSAFDSMISGIESRLSQLESRANSIGSGGGGGAAGGGGGGGGGGLFGQHGLHVERLPRDTTIFAHAGERVDVYPRGSIKPGPNRMMLQRGGGNGHVPVNVALAIEQQIDGRTYGKLVGRYLLDGITAS